MKKKQPYTHLKQLYNHHGFWPLMMTAILTVAVGFRTWLVSEEPYLGGEVSITIDSVSAPPPALRASPSGETWYASKALVDAATPAKVFIGTSWRDLPSWEKDCLVLLAGLLIGTAIVAFFNRYEKWYAKASPEAGNHMHTLLDELNRLYKGVDSPPLPGGNTLEALNEKQKQTELFIRKSQFKKIKTGTLVTPRGKKRILGPSHKIQRQVLLPVSKEEKKQVTLTIFDYSLKDEYELLNPEEHGILIQNHLIQEASRRLPALIQEHQNQQRSNFHKLLNLASRFTMNGFSSLPDSNTDTDEISDEDDQKQDILETNGE